MVQTINYRPFIPEDFSSVKRLGNEVHGDGYITDEILTQWYNNSFYHGHNISFVAYAGDKLVGFRITFAPQHWQLDQWVTPEKWPVSPDEVCYFKCNTVDEHYRGYGIGKSLLQHSIDTAKAQGATAGVSHLWKQSPNNSAVSYFTRCGGQFIKEHPDKWHEESKNGYDCILCGHDCHCVAVEMIIVF
jgi:ribosomal protein S18 acetylase RimI-like enzyme